MGSVRRGGNRGFFLYLGLNVIVSAVTVFAVLTLWDRRRVPLPTPFPTATIDAAAILASAVPTSTETLIPTATPYVYRVQPDDSLFGIALQLGVSLSDLMALNDLNETSVLDVGQILLVPTPGTPSAPVATLTSAGAEATATPPPAAEAPVVAIVGVSGVGDLTEEAVQVLNSGGVAAMAGWTLEDGEGAVFVFPEFTLHRGAVSVHSRAGQDTVIDLFWGLAQPLWSPGSTITLRDAAGTVQSTFTIPPAS
jgi:LysM repeat protein